MRTPIEFTTSRLRLRCWRESDREPFAALNADPVVREFFPSLQTREESDAGIASMQASFDAHGWGNWAVERRDNGEFIGFVGLSIPRAALPCSPCVEIGWRLARAAWGAGYAREAALAALRVGFEVIALDEIVSVTALANQRSWRVMQAIGMHNNGEDFDHPSVAAGHPLRRHCLYRLSRADWQASQPGIQT